MFGLSRKLFFGFRSSIKINLSYHSQQKGVKAYHNIIQKKDVMPNRFDNLASQLSACERKRRILTALSSSAIIDENELRQVIRQKTYADAASFLRRKLVLDEFDAAALARILVLEPAVLVKGLETCGISQFGADDRQCPNPYGLCDFVADAIKIVNMYLPQNRRTPPLMISSLARSGKTTALSALFSALKDDGNVCPIIISCSQSAGFTKRTHESCCDAFLRLVAAQFVDNPGGDFFCTEEALEAHFGNATVVLLIDDLNALCAPMDVELSYLMKRMFLDRPNRFLVFSTDHPLFFDVGESFIRSSSQRVSEKIQLPRCTNMDVLRGMAHECSGLQPCCVALYSGIPSMIYLSCINSLDIRQSFEGRQIEPSVFSDELVQENFVAELLGGTGFLRDFDVFSSKHLQGRKMFPVAYIECIIRRMDISISYGVTEVVNQLEKYSNRDETGKDWECIVLLALLLRCFEARRLPYVMFNAILINCPEHIIFATLPSTCNDLDLAKLELGDLAGSRTSCVIIGHPSIAKFPHYDAMLLVRRRGVDDVYVGLQIKVGNVCPACADEKAPKGWKSFLLRGDATPDISGTPGNGWIHPERKFLADFLGYSLGALYSANC